MNNMCGVQSGLQQYTLTYQLISLEWLHARIKSLGTKTAMTSNLSKPVNEP